MCTREEQYRRFAQGVGLPVEEEFFVKRFRAWPRAQVSLLEVNRIWKQSCKRSDIEGYIKFRSALYAVALQLSHLSGSALPGEAVVKETAERLTTHIETLVR